MEMVVSRLVENPKQAAELGISEEQLTALKDGMYELRKRQVDLNAELEKAALEQARLMTETTIDEVALMAAVEKTGSIRTELAKLRITQLLLVKKTLTAEQIEALKKKIQERMENRGRKREEGADVRGNRPERGEAGKGEGQGRDGEERRKGKKQEIRERREEKRADQQDNKKWHDEEDGDVADKMEL
jgi:Spy/CpxP family protein refolding chaperone